MEASWVLGLMLTLAKAEPPSRHLPTYPETAEAIALESEAAPLPLGPDAARKTAALLVTWSWLESRYDQKARGDHGTSYCLMQLSNTNFRALGVQEGEELDDPRACVRKALRWMAASFRICAARPLGERGAWYAAGGNGCLLPDRVLALSRARFALAKRLYEAAKD